MFKLLPHTATHVATSDFQAALLSKLLVTGTHLQKRAVAMHSYSPVSTLHPQVRYANDKENDNELLLTLLAACTTRVQ